MSSTEKPSSSLAMAEHYLERARQAPSAFYVRTNAHRALDYDPNCLEAEGLLAAVDAEGSVKKYYLTMQDIFARGEKRLQTEGYLPGSSKSVWDIKGGPPYLRTLAGYANTLIGFELYRGAAGALERILEMDPSDHLEVRRALSHLYAMTCDREAAAKLESMFPQDTSSIYWMGHALLHYRLRDMKKTKSCLSKIKSLNRGGLRNFVLALGNQALLAKLTEDVEMYGVAFQTVDELIYSYHHFSYVYKEAYDFVAWLRRTEPILPDEEETAQKREKEEACLQANQNTEPAVPRKKKRKNGKGPRYKFYKGKGAPGPRNKKQKGQSP